MKIICNSKKLESIRIKKGFSRYALSSKAGLSKMAVQRIEMGAVNPTPKSAKKICDALNVSFEEIFTIEWFKELGV